MKRYFLTFFIFYFVFNSPFCCSMESNHGLDGNEQYIIDAAKNARTHSNMGNIYFAQGNMISAITEYKIAYNLNPNSASSAVYLYNLARCYMKLNNYAQAKIYLENAIKKDFINMTYYEAVVDCYIALNIQQNELKRCLKDNQNPYNRVVAGLIFLKTGNKTAAKNIFDEFVNKNPDMIISSDLRQIMKEL